MKKLIWIVLTVPLIPLAVIYYFFAFFELIGVLASRVTNYLLFAEWRSRYINWRDDNF